MTAFFQANRHKTSRLFQDLRATETRYYELKTHVPLFCNRDSKVVYSLAEVDRERRDGYGWYTYEPQKVLKAFPEWAKKWGI